MSRPYVPLTVDPVVTGSRTVLGVAGEVDLATVPQLRAAIDGALAAGAEEVCVDLTETTFMDSSGLHVLVDAVRRARAQRRELKLVCPPGPVARVIEIAGIAELIPHMS